MTAAITRQELLELIENAAQTGQTELDLRNQGIRELPAEIGQLSNLHLLDISLNQLTGLPDMISQLSNLQWLYLDNNQLTELPDVMGQLSNLQWLYIDNNPLNPALESAYEAGFDSVMAYLRSLHEAA